MASAVTEAEQRRLVEQYVSATVKIRALRPFELYGPDCGDECCFFCKKDRYGDERNYQDNDVRAHETDCPWMALQVVAPETK